MEQYKCDKCGREYKTEGYYKKHIKKCEVIPIRKNNQTIVHQKNGVLVHPVNLDKNISVNGKKILFDKDVMKEVILSSAGSVTFLAKVYGVSYPTIKKYIDENSDLSELMEKQQHLVIDKASDNLYNAILDGNIEISKWVLTHLQTRFKERQEVQNDIKIQVITQNPNLELL